MLQMVPYYVEFSIVYHDLEDSQLINTMDLYTDNYLLLWLRAFKKQYADNLLQE